MEIGPTGAQFGHSDAKDERYCSRFDGGEIVRKAVAAGSEYVVLWVRDGDYAYHDSRILPKAPGLRDRDPLRDAVREARAAGIPLIAYCVVQQGGHFLEAHPEWEMRGSNRKPIGRFCLNSGYLEGMKQIVAEELAYGIDGFHIDMLDQGFGQPYGCWCDTCQREFTERYHHQMPEGATWDAAWDDMLEFRYRSSERFEKALAAHIKSLNPRASVDFNYHGNPPFSFEVGQRPVQHAGNADFVTGETGVWGFSALGVGLNAEFYRASTPGRPFQVAMQRGVRMYHDQTTRPLNDIRWELFTLMAHGAFVTMVDKTGLEGGLDPMGYQRTGAAFREARRLREHFGQETVGEVGLYFSSRSRDWIGRENAARFFLSFQGAHKALVQEHIPFRVVLDENVTSESLKAFPVVCLTNAGILSAREVELLRRYVEEGGRLLITGQSALFDERGKPLPESGLAGLIGAHATGRVESVDNWFRFSPADAAGGDSLKVSPWAGWPFLVKGPAAIYQPTTARSIGDLLAPERTHRQLEGKEGTEWPMSPGLRLGPAVLVNSVGRGTVLTFAGSPDFSTGSEHSIVEARKLLRNAVRLLNPKPAVEISAPANVETIVTREAPGSARVRVHLIGYNSTPQSIPERNRPFVLPGLIEDAPIFRAHLSLERAPRRVRAVSPTTELRHRGREVDLLVSDIHETLVIDF